MLVNNKHLFKRIVTNETNLYYYFHFSITVYHCSNFDIYLFFQIDPNTAFLRAARAGQLDTVVDLLDSGAVKDINTCNSVCTLPLLNNVRAEAARGIQTQS